MLKSNGKNKKTSINAFFGFLFIILGVILIFLQITIFLFQENFAFWRLLLIFLFTISSLSFGGSLVYLEKTYQEADKTAAIIALVLCIGLISLMSFLVITKSPNITAIEYIIMIIYAVISGIYGFVGVI